MKTTVTTSVGGKQITIETGRLAKQADGAALVSSGNNMVLVTATSSKKASELDFFPLTVEYIEKFYATGKIPGGYFKREAKPTNDAVLIARLIDRPIRPSFPEGYRHETQIVATVLSADGAFPLEILASVGASAALHCSDIPFNGPTAAVQIARVDGQFVANPTPQQMEKSDMDMIVAGTRNGLLMVEGETKFISEADALAALKFGHQSLIPLLNAQDELREKAGSVAKRAFTAPSIDADFKGKAEGLLRSKIAAALSIKEKQDRYAAANEAAAEAEKALLSDIVDKDLLKLRKKELNAIVEDLKYQEARSMILDRAVRIDGRDVKTVRPIANEVGILPRAHGSGLFTRGETQVLGTVTLGTADDEQMVDSLLGLQKRKFMLHYNFPPYSVGEVGRMSGTSRREIGHGNLAERAIKAVLPDFEKFPYTIRIVSEVLESNGSSSMGTVCSGIMALLDAGVPLKGNVAGVAMGLIKEGDRIAVLTDILGDEDHLGDMDFKVAGSPAGITALQMDIKIDSVSFEVMEQALAQAKEGRAHILNEMEKVMKVPRGQISEFAPRIETIKIKPDKIREVIGSGGKVIRGITEATGVKIEIQDDGTINIASADPEATKKAIAMINDIIAEAEVGKTYKGRIVKIAEFGAFVEILPNTQGLLHISEISNERVRAVSDVLKEGEIIDVKVLEVDRSGRVKLSRKALLQ
ncbi:polyribonucleotide nucleotidyltransferase [Bdellovibrio bacteriovorus]|uniref:Polyribonucleotide nucleotidyltransferase n=1 Tax=Bdellovibrio bacteriovorus str. Tiberius TaxID=1069642 RepID=K7YN31_BDEBC|nr:polyribonucleotide nucleotidyltransferase [Bdellovibrio bacteriovorus]AFY01241.1 polynucleotide phosphorylase/polyadenylase [Bdellovibrio bacteriovorus str. Tiberius]